MQRPKHTDSLSQQPQWVIQLCPWSQRFQVSHMHGRSGRRNLRAFLSNNRSFPTYQDGNTPGATEGLNTPILHSRTWPWVTFTYRRAAGALLCPGAVAHWAVSHHMLDHRQENLASAWPYTAESRYAFSPLPAPSKDKRSFRPKGTCPHWLQVTLIQLLGCTLLARKPNPFSQGWKPQPYDGARTIQQSKS